MEENHKLQKVVSGPVKTKKRSEFRRIAEEFLAEDIIDIRSHVKSDIIIPAIKRIIIEAVNLALYNTGASFDSDLEPSYRAYGNVSRDNKKRSVKDRTKNNFGLDDIVLGSRVDAENVLDNMQYRISKYGSASVADLYDLLGEVCPYTYESYGWADIRSAKIILVRNGYLLRLPRPLPID